MNQPALVLSDISFRYDPAGSPVIRDISLRVERGETVCVLGPSGSGKTTLLKVAASLLKPTTGEVRSVEGVVGEPGPDRIVVFQDQDQLFPWKTVLGNVKFPLRYVLRLGDAESERRANAAIEEVELPGVSSRFPYELSGGMRQRVALARAVAIEPPVLLLDEPFAAVDAPTRERLGTLLVRLQRHHDLAVLFVTHDVDEAIRLGHRIVVLGRDGEVRFRGDGFIAKNGENAPTNGPRPSSAVERLRRQVRGVLDE